MKKWMIIWLMLVMILLSTACKNKASTDTSESTIPKVTGEITIEPTVSDGSTFIGEELPIADGTTTETTIPEEATLPAATEGNDYSGKEDNSGYSGGEEDLLEPPGMDSSIEY